MSVSFVDPDPYSDELEPIRPDIRFTNQFVVGVVFEKPTGIYDVQVDKVIRLSDHILVKVDVRKFDETGAAETSSPYQFVKVDGVFDLPVEFDLNDLIEPKKQI